MECVSAKSTKHCTCSCLDCDKRGNCCQCVQYHRQRDQIPGCFFTTDGERSLDRSLASFLRDRSR